MPSSAERGIEVSEVDDQPWGRFVYFADPDGNRWALQQLPDWSAGAGGDGDWQAAGVDPRAETGSLSTLYALSGHSVGSEPGVAPGDDGAGEEAVGDGDRARGVLVEPAGAVEHGDAGAAE